MNIRKICSYLHLYLGLSSGLIVLIVALTGSIYVFEKEIYAFIHPKVIYINNPPPKASPLPLSKLKQIATSAINGKDINYIITYQKPTRSWEFIAYKPGDPQSFFYFDALDYHLGVFINPYTGKINKIRDYKYDFFNIIKYHHWNLLINHPLGQQLVGIATLIYIILLVSGLILWLPRKFKISSIKPRLTIKLNARFKRLNHDLHNVLGFYTLIFALVIAITGLVWTYQWVGKTIYLLTNGQAQKTEILYSSKPNNKNINIYNNAIDNIFYQVQHFSPKAQRTSLSLANSAKGVIYISQFPDEEAFYGTNDFIFDQYNGKLLFSKLYSTKNKGERLLNANYDLHVGTIWGLTGKIIAFIVSLIAASLPITGFIFWLGKK